MGCDIHLCLEYRRKNSNDAKWESYQCGEVWSDRFYPMFAALADVRNYYEIEHIELKGFPEDASFHTKRNYYLMVVPDEEYDPDLDIRWCPKSRAEKWGGEIFTMNGYEYTEHPDWHSPNWSTTEEMHNAICSVFKDSAIGDIEWQGLLGTMEGLERSGDYECRAVFWFDN